MSRRGEPRGLYITGTPEERFWPRVNKDGPVMPGMDTPCWEWTGYRNRKGYGQFSVIGNESVLTHRFAWTRAHGPVPNGLELCHRCNNRACVRDEHLYAGTHQENIDDAVRSGSYVDRPVIRGEAHYALKMTDCDVEQLRLLAALHAAPAATLAEVFGTTRKHAAAIIEMRKRTYLGRPLVMKRIIRAGGLAR